MTQAKKTWLELPPDVVAALELTPDSEVHLTVKGNALVVTPLAKEPGPKREPWRWPAWAAGIGALLALGYWLITKQGQVPLSGDWSLASLVIGGGAVSGIGLFIGFFIQSRFDKRNRFSEQLYWRHFVTITVAFLMILVLALMGLFWLLGEMFPGASFDIFTATLIVGLLLFGVNFLMSWAAVTINADGLVWLLGVVIVGGSVIAMAANGTRRWWEYNLSFLGTSQSANSWSFNLALIFSALILLALIDYLFVALNARYPRSRRLWLLRMLLIITALDLGAVGLFPNNKASHDLHDAVAGLLVTCIVALVIGLRFLLPEVSRDFLRLSYAVAGFLLLLEMGFRFFRYPSLTAFEIQAFPVAFGWLVMVFGQLKRLAGEAGLQVSGKIESF